MKGVDVKRIPLTVLIRKGVSGILSLIYPEHCGGCGCRLDHNGEQRGKPGTVGCDFFLCKACQARIPAPPECRCPVCSHPMQGLFQCSNCEGRRWHLTTIVAACRFEGLVQELIQRFKYGRDQSLLPILSQLMLPALDDTRLAGKKFDAVVPVPLHPLREREREFNQSDLLAGSLAKRLGIPVRRLLKRNRATAPQAGFDRSARLQNLKGAFSLRRPPSADASFLLVDDVATTGTTLDACAAILMEGGASEVCAVTIARG